VAPAHRRPALGDGYTVTYVDCGPSYRYPYVPEPTQRLWLAAVATGVRYQGISIIELWHATILASRIETRPVRNANGPSRDRSVSILPSGPAYSGKKEPLNT
jgi:hypothetical protein